jgi:2-hydroxychromene-2-carboxylate isomerase
VSDPLFFFGAMSPYSWMAAERIDGLLPGARWRPVFVGGLLKAAGRVSWGLTGERAAHAAECEARARARGLGAIRWPDPWPTSDLLVARAMLHAEAAGRLRPFALAAMRLAFLEGRDLGEPATVEAAAGRAGLDPGEVLAATADPAVKDRLRAATQEALDLGVTGVPTVLVAGERFWGDDRLGDAALAG